MLLDTMVRQDHATRVAAEVVELVGTLYPICRSITGDGVRRTLDVLQQWIELERHEVPSGTPVFDWEVPDEWNIRDAFVADPNGRRVVDFRAHNLHVVGYSTPVRARLTLDELQPHLHSLPEHPDRIPYRTSYYKRDWGFCLRHADRERLGPGPFDVLIDADLQPGHLSYAECVVPGTTGGEAIVYTHTCHPSLANDNLTGIAVAAAVARELRAQAAPRLTWRFVFGPGTIGSLTWLARNEPALQRLRGGFVVGLLGDDAELTYKRSRRGDSAADRVAELVLPALAPATRFVDFEPYGYDERQFCSPGFDLPVGRLTRSQNAAYDQYHTSADDLSMIRPARLAESIQALAALIRVLDIDRRPLNLSPKGEPRLGKHGLYGDLGGVTPGAFQNALLWVLNQADGQRSLTGIARRSGLDPSLLDLATSALERCGLVGDADDARSATSEATR